MSLGARLTVNGNLLVNGSFDENTSISPAKFRITANTGYAGTFNEVTDMIVTDGLLLYVNGSSDVYSGTGTIWSDLSNYNNNATLTNSPTYNVGTGGGSFAFNGSTQYAPVTAALLNTTYTGKTVFFVGRLNAAAWTPGVAQFRAMFGSAGSPRNFNFYVHQSAANVVDFHYSTPGSAFFTGAVSLGTNWFVAAVTQDATTTKVYLNGTEIYSVAGQTLNQYANGGEEAVAQADNYFYGDVAVCALYSRGLSAAEILNNYNAFAARVGLTPTIIAPVGRDSSDGTMYVTGIFDEFTGASVVNNGLTMWLDFGQTSSYLGSGATVTDLSPTHTANVTLTGSPTFNSIDGGGSGVFNGSTQYGTGAGTPLGLSAYTKSFWFKLTSYSSNNIVSSDVGGHFCFFGGSNKLSIGHSFWSNFGAFTSVATFNLNTWYNACVTFNTATGMALYVNGTLDSTYVSTTTNPTNTPVTGTGRVDIANYAASNFLTGSIGQVMVYNQALSADEITTNFNALRGRYGI